MPAVQIGYVNLTINPATNPDMDPCPCGGFSPAGDPVDLLTGGKHEVVVDYTDGDDFDQVVRTYRATSTGVVARPEFGQSWYGIVPAVGAIDPTTGILTVSTPDGFTMRFTYNPASSSWTYASSYPKVLVPTLVSNFTVPTDWRTYLQANAGNWTLTLPDGQQLSLSTSPGAAYAAVFVAASLSPTGYQTSYTYNLDATNRWQVATIAGADGRTMRVTWADTVVSQVALPDGSSLQYSHDAPSGGTGHTDRLTNVQRLSAAGSVLWSQSYLYENTNLPYAFTGTVDALGVRRTVETLNNAGQVTSSSKADNTETLTFAYGTPSSGVVTNSITNQLSKTSTYTFTTPSNSLGAHQTGQSDAPTSLSPSRQSTSIVGADGNISSETDFKGNVTLYSGYDSHSRATSWTLANGTSAQRTETTSWYPTLDKPTEQTVPGLTTDYTYDALGRVLTKKLTDTTTTTAPYSTNGQTRTWTYTWTTGGKLASIDGPKGLDINGKPDTTTFAYDANNNLQTSTNGLGQVTTFSNYDANGRPGRMVEPNGRITDFTYDHIGRLATRTVRGGSDGDAVTTLTYDLEGQLTSITPPATDTLYFDYTAVGRLNDVHDSAGNKITYAYDVLGNRTSDTTTRADNSIRKTVGRTFDDLSRMLTETLGPNRTTSWTYDNNDNPTKVTSARSYATTLAFDPLDRLASTIDAKSGSTSNGYDGQDNLTSHTDRISVATTYVRDGFGEVIQETSPDRGTTVYTYDAAGDVVQVTDGRGQTINYARDALGRILSKKPVGVTGQDITYVYDTDTSHIGRLAGMGDASGSTTFAYDNRGNVKTRTIKVGTTFTASVGYVYDAADRLIKITYPSGKAVTYARDARGRVSGVSLTVAGVTTPLASGLTYDAFGPLMSMSLGNGLALTQNFGSDDRLYTKTLSNGATPVWAKTYTYDNDDNMTGITDGVSSTENRTYSYDELSRLTQATGLLASGITRENYTYDANDNRLSLVQRKLVTDTTPSQTENSTIASGTNRLAAVSGQIARSFTFDGRGSFASEGRGTATLTYGYDAYGRLASAANTAYPTKTMTMVYNGLDERAQVTSGTTTYTFLYDQSQRLIGEYGTRVSAIVAEHIWLTPDPDEAEGWQPLALVGPTTTTWVTGDHLGTPAYLTTSTGAVANSYEATPWGGRWKSLVSSPTTALGQPGQIEDDVTYRAYNLHRDYDPSLGRYIEADPIGLAGGENVYGYVGGNPIDLFDPRGLRVGLSYAMPTSYFAKLDAADTNFPNEFTVSAHGGDDGTMAYDSRYANVPTMGDPLTAEQIVHDILNSGRYKKNSHKPIRLLICNAGKGGNRSLAGQVAKLLPGTPIIGPDNLELQGFNPWHDYLGFLSPVTDEVANGGNWQTFLYRN